MIRIGATSGVRKPDEVHRVRPNHRKRGEGSDQASPGPRRSAERGIPVERRRGDRGQVERRPPARS